MLKLTFLGTSAGVPTKQRNVTALAIECLNPYLSGASPQPNKSRPWVLIDCGEGTQQQLLQTKLSLHQLTAICITHVHGDHCYGLPGLLASAAMSGRHEPLMLIAPKAIAKLLDAITLTTELYFPFAINFMAIEDVLSKDSEDEGKVSFSFGSQHQLDIDITPLSHRVASYGFGITQNISQRTLNTDKLTADGIPASALWGKLQQGTDVMTEDGRQLRSADYVDNAVKRTRVVVAGDNGTPACLSAALVDTDLLVHEATYTQEVLTKIQTKNPDFDPMHSSAQLVGKFAQDVGLKNLILTHFSARYQSFDNPNSNTANMGHIRLDAQRAYQGNLWLAADFAQYTVDGAADLASSQEDNSVQYLGSARDNET
ncbi:MULTISPECIES: ribonuclease Z [Psychrobacter]|jgi:ribonuclease Z|uniref:ribonuclease Z n=1 Tax=Psychrobacter TaxID=497 RepID=UPI0003FC3933|nr:MULTISPECIES: ribonuclease Z [Psychrobacter]NRD69303.1 ribonuclease Z [Psychrobacter okhotskensis]PKG35234.1 MBL fold metallo-hydrolase [Psychrobacter sp. Sarcosine-3u-12]